MKRWSKTRVAAEALFDPELHLAIRLTSIRAEASDGAEFALLRIEERDTRAALFALPLDAPLKSQLLSVSEVAACFQDWIQSEPTDFLSTSDGCETLRPDLDALREFLFVVDRRVGKRRLQKVLPALKSDGSRQIAERRMRTKAL